jgi:hypothetical protein
MPWPIIAAAAITAGGSIWNSISGNAAVDRASRRQLTGVREGIKAQERQFGETKANLQPYINEGQKGLAELSRRTLSGEFNKPFTAEMMNADPGLQYRMQQANLALERSASARGRLLSGGTIRNIAELNQSLASQEFGAAYERNRVSNNDEFNRLSSLSNTGLGAAEALGGVSSGLGSSLADLYTTQGQIGAENALAKGQIGQTLTTDLSNNLSSTLLQLNTGGTSVKPQSAQPIDTRNNDIYQANRPTIKA